MYPDGSHTIIFLMKWNLVIISMLKQGLPRTQNLKLISDWEDYHYHEYCWSPMWSYSLHQTVMHALYRINPVICTNKTIFAGFACMLKWYLICIEIERRNKTHADLCPNSDKIKQSRGLSDCSTRWYRGLLWRFFTGAYLHQLMQHELCTSQNVSKNNCHGQVPNLLLQTLMTVKTKFRESYIDCGCQGHHIHLQGSYWSTWSSFCVSICTPEGTIIKQDRKSNAWINT